MPAVFIKAGAEVLEQPLEPGPLCAPQAGPHKSRSPLFQTQQGFNYLELQVESLPMHHVFVHVFVQIAHLMLDARISQRVGH